MSSVISQIAEWGTKLPYWEQAALERIISGQNFSDDDFNELLQFLLEDADLAEKKSKRPQLRLKDYIVSEESKSIGKPFLRQISNLENVNALVTNQKIEFGDYLTILYGDNGSGKSGYARVIASAAFSRGDKEILRDIRKPLDESAPLSADILLDTGESQPKPIHHIVGTVCPEMHSFYVFDSTSVRAHLMKANVISFSPAGLDTLTKLVDVTDEVRKRLLQRIESLQKKNLFEALFMGETEVSQEIHYLSPGTDVDRIRNLGQFSDEDSKKLKELDRKIAELKLIDFPKQIAIIEQTIEDIKSLIKSLEATNQTLGDPIVSTIQASLSKWHEQNALAAQLSAENFKVDGLNAVGSAKWYEFVRSAIELSAIESKGDQYPQPGAICLLCHQPLSTEAHDYIHNLWKMLKSDTQKNISALTAQFKSHQQSLTSVDLGFFNEQTVSYRYLKANYSTEFKKIINSVASSKKRQSQLLSSIDKKESSDVIALPATGIDDLWRLIGLLEAERAAAQEKQKNAEGDINRFQHDLLLLEHRKILHSVLDDVLAYIEGEKWIKQASSTKVKGNSAHITKKYNALFSELVTDKYIKLFNQTLKDLQCPMDIEISYKAQKGETYKQIELKTCEKYPHDLACPEKVLSEGEQRAVALADFFTEIALDEQSSGFVLDDPVTSLDFHWETTIAENIVKQAQSKQAIIFTHDMHFFSCLKTIADKKEVEIRAHWIQKRDGVPGYVYIDNSPMSEKDYKLPTRAKAFLDKATTEGISAEDRQFYIEKGFGALRTSYEVFIIYELFGGTVLRFEERVSGDRLKKTYYDEAIRDQVVDSIGRISRYIDAHSHSDINSGELPTPLQLGDEIKFFTQMRTSHKEIKKQHGITD